MTGGLEIAPLRSYGRADDGLWPLWIEEPGRLAVALYIAHAFVEAGRLVPCPGKASGPSLDFVTVGAEDQHFVVGVALEESSQPGQARITARAMMSDPAEVKGLQARDLAKYGNPDGPTFEQLLEKNRKKGATGDDVYLGIIDSSQRTNKAANAQVKK